MEDATHDPAGECARQAREVDLVEWAMLAAFFLIGLTALIGELDELLR